ncbi:3-ketodihydrosphingosine reductase [Glycine max]|nr:3-ketodihydrosphingosine reductase [Glycine max]
MRSMASSASSRGIAAIVGVGPNLGLSIARKFAHEGYTVAILARDLGRLSRFADEIAREEKAQVFAIRIDCSDSRSVREAFEGVLSLGFVEILVYNAYQPLPWYPTSFQDLRVDSFEKSLAISSVGAFHCAQQVLSGMVERGKGTILFTGCSASLNGIVGYSELCKYQLSLLLECVFINFVVGGGVNTAPNGGDETGCGKFALRALSQCLAKEFQPQGVHVAHVIIDGVIGPPRGPMLTTTSSSSQRRNSLGEQSSGVVGGGEGTMDPDSLAQTFWHLHVQDRNAWTQEMDLRSPSARFF